MFWFLRCINDSVLDRLLVWAAICLKLTHTPVHSSKYQWGLQAVFVVLPEVPGVNCKFGTIRNPASSQFQISLNILLVCILHCRVDWNTAIIQAFSDRQPLRTELKNTYCKPQRCTKTAYQGHPSAHICPKQLSNLLPADLHMFACMPCLHLLTYSLFVGGSLLSIGIIPSPSTNT